MTRRETPAVAGNTALAEAELSNRPGQGTIGILRKIFSAWLNLKCKGDLNTLPREHHANMVRAANMELFSRNSLGLESYFKVYSILKKKHVNGF